MIKASTLIPVVPLEDYPGCLPAEPIDHHLAMMLLDAGESVRVLAERERAEGWPETVEVIEGSIRFPSETPKAFEHLKALFLAGADPATAQEALSLAREGGAAKVVNLSSHGPDVEITLPPDHWHWLALEVLVERSGITWTHVVPSLSMAVTLTGSYPLALKSWRDLIHSGQTIRRPFTDAKFPFIHEKDLAEVIFTVLRTSDFDGKKIHASGRLISDVERVHVLRDVLKKDIVLEQLSTQQTKVFYQEQGCQHMIVATCSRPQPGLLRVRKKLIEKQSVFWAVHF
jgi:uncharacterized protein YbjT (DUF2867 family)